MQRPSLVHLQALITSLLQIIGMGVADHSSSHGVVWKTPVLLAARRWVGGGRDVRGQQSSGCRITRSLTVAEVRCWVAGLWYYAMVVRHALVSITPAPFRLPRSLLLFPCSTPGWPARLSASCQGTAKCVSLALLWIGLPPGTRVHFGWPALGFWLIDSFTPPIMIDHVTVVHLAAR